jgi:hypothetical protein
MGQHLHTNGLKLTVDVASWNHIWNWTLIAESQADRVITMTTYTGTSKFFIFFFSFLLSLLSLTSSEYPQKRKLQLVCLGFGTGHE